MALICHNAGFVVAQFGHNIFGRAMSTKAHAVCMHTQRRVEQQLVIVSHLSKQWHHPHLGGGRFLLWGAACAHIKNFTYIDRTLNIFLKSGSTLQF